MVKIIESGCLSPSQYDAAIKTLHKKCTVYTSGCRKRNRLQEAAKYTALMQKFPLGRP
jgi:hypothetical protein